MAVRVAQGWTLGYDADGNLLTKSDTSGRHDGTAWRYAYNAAGRLSEVWRDDGAGEARVGAYGYDVLGRRVTREAMLPDGSPLAEQMLWDGDVPAERRRAEPLAEERASDARGQTRTYAFQGFEPLALLDGEDDTALVECDQVGQPRLAVDREGTLVWEGQFDAWGGDLGTRGELEVDLRFPGQTADGESGLSYNRFRHYDSQTRLYTSSDPLGIVGGPASFGYVIAPLLWVDVYGLAGCNWRRSNGYKTNDVDSHRLLSPGANRAPGHSPSKADSLVQSHHPVQDAWAQANVPGYNRNDAPAVLLRSSSGQPHASISAAQRARRRALKDQGSSPWSTSIRQEFDAGYREMIDSGVPPRVARRAINRSYQYFDRLNAFGP